jgi:hypothetical protein
MRTRATFRIWQLRVEYGSLPFIIRGHNPFSGRHAFRASNRKRESKSDHPLSQAMVSASARTPASACGRFRKSVFHISDDFEVRFTLESRR